MGLALAHEMSRVSTASAEIVELTDVLLGVLHLVFGHVDSSVLPAAHDLNSTEEHVPQGLVSLGRLGRASDTAQPREKCPCRREGLSESAAMACHVLSQASAPVRRASHVDPPLREFQDVDPVLV